MNTVESGPFSDPLIGQTIGGRFEILDTLGVGGMGVVYKARQMPIDRLVALKLLSGELSTDRETVQRFLNEARIISRLKHRNTVKLHDFGETSDGRLFIAMEYLDGGTLRDVLDRGRVGVKPALRLIREIALSLSEAHAAEIVHRDLKPENILFEDVYGEDFSLRVLDFGIAKLHVAGPRLTAPGTRLGTPEYMAPEQAWGDEVDHRTDLYALGIMFYELLTGQVPFFSQNQIEIYLKHQQNAPRPFSEFEPPLEVAATVEALVMKLLAKEKDERPQSTEELVSTIDALLAGRAEPIPKQAPAADVFESAPALEEPDDDSDALAEVYRAQRQSRLFAAGAVLAAGGIAGAIYWLL